MSSPTRRPDPRERPRRTRSGRVAFLVAFVLPSGAPLACTSRAEPPAADGAADAAGAVHQDAGALEGPCLLDGERCTAASGAQCCEPSGLFLVDLPRNCKASKRTPFSCNPTPVRPGVKVCVSPDETTCLWRTVDDDGGTDAGIEVFYGDSYDRPAGLASCDRDLYQQAQRAAARDCP